MDFFFVMLESKKHIENVKVILMKLLSNFS